MERERVLKTAGSLSAHIIEVETCALALFNI